MGLSKEIFAPQRPGRGLRMPKLYLGRFAEFKNGLGLEFGSKMRIRKELLPGGELNPGLPLDRQDPYHYTIKDEMMMC